MFTVRLWANPDFWRLVNFTGASQMALVVKNLPANIRDAGDSGLIPGSGRSPGGGNGSSLQYSCLGNPMDRGAWQGTPWQGPRVAKASDTAEHVCTEHKHRYRLIIYTEIFNVRHVKCIWKCDAQYIFNIYVYMHMYIFNESLNKPS